MIRRYIAWRNRHVTDPALRKVVRRAETYPFLHVRRPSQVATLRC
jgi:hypothetical protein